MKIKSAYPIFAAMFAVATLGLTIQACDKDDKGDIVSPNGKSVSAARAAQGAIKFPEIGGTNLKEFGPELRSIYMQGMAQAKQFKNIEGETPDLSQFDICSVMTSSCAQIAAAEPIVEEGMTCTTSCPAAGGTTMNCTSAEQISSCKGIQYTTNDLISNSTTSCTKTSPTLYTLGISVDMSGKVKGGDITESTELVCKFNFAMAFDFENPSTGDTQAFDTTQLCNNMVCTIGGEAMSCQDMQEAMKEDTCS